jgi:threonine dehydratase
MMQVSGPSVDAIRELRATLGADIYRTPMLRCGALEERLADSARISAKLEFLQRTGTFKARGALAVLKRLSAKQRAAGVTAVSAGNHAIATAFAAAVTGTSAKVVMIRSASPVRMELCRAFGAELVLADNVHAAFETAERIERDEGRFFVHPFEGPDIAAGTGTIGLEISEQDSDFDAVLVPIGGGGLIGGMANALKQLRPDVEIIGVEPVGADTMHRSLRLGSPQAIDKVRTVADSLGAPFALPYSFELCRQHVDRIVLIEDDQLREAMGFLFSCMNIAVEPACAATTAAVLGPLRDEVAGRNIVLTMCGSNIDWATFAELAVFKADSC